MSRTLTALLLVLVLLCSGLAGCAKQAQPPSPPTEPAEQVAPAVPQGAPLAPAPAVTPGPSAVGQAPSYEEMASLGLGFRSGPPAPAAARPAAYGPLRVTAAVVDYRVAADLSNVANLSRFAAFTPEQQKLLAANGFFAAPSDFIQPFFLYENNTYWDIPSFVTTDSVLHTYHLFFDWAMRGVEYLELYPKVTTLTQQMCQRASALYAGAPSANVKDAALAAVIYFGVPARLLGLDLAVPDEAKEPIERELAKIQAHSERTLLSFLPFEIDYTSFVPRGHYTRTERFAQYFRAMTWYGLVPFPVGEKDREPTTAELRATRVALLIAGLLEPDTEALWRDVYEITGLFVGQADDATPVQYRSVAGTIVVNQLEDDATIRVFAQKALAEIAGPGIVQQLQGIPSGPQMRFMGQRFVLDSAVLQRLVKWPERPFPTGLDVAATWGSARAKELLLGARKEGEQWAEYPSRLQEQTARVAAVTQQEWQSNLYRGWLWSFQPLLAAKPAGYPPFMQTAAWQDKQINTVLGSWTQLRHDTILYVKGSGAECGGDDQLPPPPPGYVEPEPEFYARLEWLVHNTLAELTERGLVNEAMAEQYRSFAVLLGDLKAISLKELAGQPLTKEEKDRIRFFGGALEHLSIRALGGHKGWYELASEVDREMALVADIHLSSGTVLEEAVGRPAAIFVAIPADGQLWLARGAIYSQYEFQQPAANRLTDEAWLKLVQAHQTPASPGWTGSFLTGTKAQAIEPETKVVVPCGGNGSGAENPG